jgi:virulence factor Mce-like protein
VTPKRRETSVFANPVLIGALTVLVTIVAVYLAYNSNAGLPFVPRYVLHVQMRDASELTHGSEVHMGGSLVGVVDSIAADRDATGQPIALLSLNLDEKVKPLPIDSTFVVRLKGAIGLKYLQVTPGKSSTTWEDGATVPVSQTSSAVDLDQVLSMFDAPTRKGIQATTIGFSSALAGRGNDLNSAIGAFVPLLTDLRPVAKNLSSRNTDLAGFFRGLEGFAGALAPVAQQQASLFTNLDTTFRALAGVAVPHLQNWISQTPPTFQAVIASSPTQQAFLTDTAALFAELQPGFATLPSSAPVLADAFEIGTRNLPGTAALDQRLVSLAQHVASYSATPAVQKGLDRLAQTFQHLNPPLSFLTPGQTTCNYPTLFLRNISNLLSEPTATGTSLRFLLVVIDDVLGGEAVPSQTLYTTPATNPLAGHGPVHVNPYPNTDAPGQRAECAAGNEPYDPSRAIVGNPPRNVGTTTEQTKRSGG